MTIYGLTRASTRNQQASRGSPAEMIRKHCAAVQLPEPVMLDEPLGTSGRSVDFFTALGSHGRGRVTRPNCCLFAVKRQPGRAQRQRLDEHAVLAGLEIAGDFQPRGVSNHAACPSAVDRDRRHVVGQVVHLQIDAAAGQVHVGRQRKASAERIGRANGAERQHAEGVRSRRPNPLGVALTPLFWVNPAFIFPSSELILERMRKSRGVSS